MFQSTKWRRTDSLLAHWSRWMGSYLSAHKQHEQTAMSPECFRWINQIIHCYLHLLWQQHEEGFHLHQTDGFRKNKNKSLIRWSLTRKVNWDYLVEEEAKLFEHLSISMWPRSKTFGKTAENTSVLKELRIMKQHKKGSHRSFLVYWDDFHVD